MTFTVTSAQRTKVVERAKAQLGKPYEWGAAGPDSYDCSGSTLEAWKPFLTLPHQSGAQTLAAGVRVARPGHRVDGDWPRNLIQPGDLIFYYGHVSLPTTVSHVALFIGDGQIINATGIVDGVNRGVELITIDQYAHPSGFGFVGH